MSRAHAAEPLLDFADPDAARAFRVINDAVMGGVSSSRLRSAADALVFEGVLSLENNGGFASFRGPVRIASHASAMLLTVRGDGQRYKLTLKPDDGNASPQYQAPFTAPAHWTTLRFAPTDFTASFRGRSVDAPALDLGSMRAIGLLISDRQAGPFSVELGRIDIERD